MVGAIFSPAPSSPIGQEDEEEGPLTWSCFGRKEKEGRKNKVGCDYGDGDGSGFQVPFEAARNDGGAIDDDDDAAVAVEE